MPDSLKIQPATKPIRATVRPPGSKSISNRALVCAALADGTSTLRGALDSHDTQVMIAGLQSLGIQIEIQDNAHTLRVEGCQGRFPATKADIFVGNSGTTIRFLTALAAVGQGSYRLDGIARMRERPIGDLAEALNQLGAHIECEGDNACPPVAIQASGLRGGVTSIRGNISSQFLSGLLMAAPYAQEAVTIQVAGTLVSIPYVTMTLAVMKSFGVEVTAGSEYTNIKISNSQKYQAADYAIEPDASAASYFWAAAAVTGGEVTVEGLTSNSLQGDVKLVDCLAKMGCEVRNGKNQITVVGAPLHAIEVDMNAISDTVQTLAVVALFAEGTTRIRNVAHIRHKETDRITAVATELRKLGAQVVEHTDGFDITPGKFTPAAIDTYDDHRMAMSFAIAGLKNAGIVIRDPGCTAKTYPNFFNDLGTLYPQS